MEEWIHEVAEWGRLGDYQERLQQEESLWLPTSDKEELNVLLGLAALSSALGCSPARLVHLLLESPNLPEIDTPFLPDFSTDFENAAITPEIAQVTASPDTLSPQATSTNSPNEKGSILVEANSERNELLLEALTDFQATFELALEQAELQLDPKTFPTQELEDYLAQLFDLLRAILTRSEPVYEQ